MNPGNRDTPAEEKTQRLASGDVHGHAKVSGSMVMHDHGRHSPASAHSPGVSGKLPGLRPDSSRTSRGFGTPSFPPTGLPGFSLDHLPFLLNSASSLIFRPFLHPSTGSLFPGVLPPILPPPPPPITSLFPSPGAECEVSNSGWSALSGGSRNTSSLGSSSNDGDVAAKVDGRTIRSSRCSPDISLQPSSLPAGIRKIWETTVADPVCNSIAADMPLSLVTRRETTNRGSSVAESVVCTGDSVSVARAASTETSRTPSLDGESTCHPGAENSDVQEQTVPIVGADQSVNWPAAKTTADTSQSQSADDAKSSAGDDVWSSNTAASRSLGIALPPRKRLTRNAEELQSSATTELSSEAANSPSPATNFRSCWKKFSAKSNVSVPSSHRTFGGKPQYDCRTYFHKLAETAKAAAANKAFVAGKGKGHFYRNANKTSPRSSDQNTGSPRVTRSQSKPKKSQSPKSGSPAEPPAPLRKSTRKKSFNSRFEEYDRTGGKNKKLKCSPSESNLAVSDAGKENSQAEGEEVVTAAEKKTGKNRRRGKQSSKDVDSLNIDAEDSTSCLSNDALQPTSEADAKLNSIENASVTSEGSSTNAKPESASLELEPSVVITLLPPKFRHFKNKAVASTAVLDSLQTQTNSDRCLSAADKSTYSEIDVPLKADSADSGIPTTPTEVAIVEDCDSRMKPTWPRSAENSVSAEVSVSSSSDEVKVSHFHSAGGRKSLLYRSSAVADSQPTATTETKLVPTSNGNNSSASVTTDAAGDLYASRTSANETRIDKPILTDVAVSEQQVLAEPCSTFSQTTAAKSTPAEIIEKAQSDSYDAGVEHAADELTESLQDIVPSRCASPGIITETSEKTVSVDASDTSSDYITAVVSDKSDPPIETLRNDDASALTQKLSSCSEVPTDSLNKCDSDSNVPPQEVLDVSAMSVTQSDISTISKSSDIAADTNASVSVEKNLCATLDSTVDLANGLSCRMKPYKTCSNSAVESRSQSSESLKRHMPDDVRTEDNVKRRLTDSSSVEDSIDDISLDVSQSVDNTAIANTAVIFSSGDSQDAAEHTVQPPIITNVEPASSARARSKPKPEKPKRVKEKANRRLKPNRSSHTGEREPVGVEKSGPSTANFHETVETAVVDEPPVLDKSLIVIADSNQKTPDITSNSSAIIKYAVSNSTNKVCDMNANKSSVQTSTEHKSLRISLVAITEPNGSSSHRLKDTRTETCSAIKPSDGSPAMAPASATYGPKLLMPGSAVLDAEQSVVTSGGGVVSQESVTLENDSSALLSQCKSLSVVIEKMQSRSRESPPPTPANKPRSRRPRKRHSAVPSVTTEALSDKFLLIDDRPAMEASAVPASVADEYSFTDDSLSVSLPMQRVPRSERKTSSRKARSSLPAHHMAEMSPAALSDSSSRGAPGSVDSSAHSTSTGTAASVIPNDSQQPSGKPDTGSNRAWRKKQNLEDKDERSSLSFAQNGTLLAPIVEASLDGHKLKLRITKFPNCSVGDSTTDAKVSVSPALSSSYEFPDDVTKSTEDRMPAEEKEPAPVVVAKERQSSRRRQLKVEGVRSRFLTLHKPTGLAPSADHVKCRLVKVGRRQWMSVGGEEEEDETSSRLSDTEIPVGSSPASSLIDDVAQQPTRDRLLLVSEVTPPQRRRGRPPKVKFDSVDAQSTVPSSKRTKKRVRVNASQFEIRPMTPKPELKPKVASRPVREAVVPWLDCESSSSETQPYCVLDSSFSRTIAADIELYRQNVSTPTEFMSNVDSALSDALSDRGIMFECNTVRSPCSMFFVPSELEQLMEALVLDDIRRQSGLCSPPTAYDHETCALSSASICSTFSYYDSAPVRISSPRNSSEMDLLLSQPSLRLRNCMLPVDPSDNSDYDCTFVGHEYQAHSLTDPIEPPSLMDRQYFDEDFSLSSSLADPHMYSCVDFVL